IPTEIRLSRTAFRALPRELPVLIGVADFCPSSATLIVRCAFMIAAKSVTVGIESGVRVVVADYPSALLSPTGQIARHTRFRAIGVGLAPAPKATKPGVRPGAWPPL